MSSEMLTEGGVGISFILLQNSQIESSAHVMRKERYCDLRCIQPMMCTCSSALLFGIPLISRPGPWFNGFTITRRG
jgi:hypothetical protein